ncbi:MAG: hypothetical protein ACYS7Y_19135 [Planctomycetota bacterium]|jgi:hypothetical protein
MSENEPQPINYVIVAINLMCIAVAVGALFATAIHALYLLWTGTP